LLAKVFFPLPNSLVYSKFYYFSPVHLYLSPADLAPQWALPTSSAMCNMLHVAVAELRRLRQIPRQHFKNSAHDLIKCNASCLYSNFPPGRLLFSLRHTLPLTLFTEASKMSRQRVVTRAQSSQVHVKVAALLHFYKVNAWGGGWGSGMGWDRMGCNGMGYVGFVEGRVLKWIRCRLPYVTSKCHLHVPNAGRLLNFFNLFVLVLSAMFITGWLFQRTERKLQGNIFIENIVIYN